ncbi:uncharacterized protein BKCO1_800028 [Diplodia corticola]|uniref:O-methyltransferase family 3 n=1 Tax=Diplodia corticola TaxID=236234 RepID=A0A1J9R9H9_9PEZI|nr:uncharacterized protein BKCO1_800028 [Diplodia corticola]OJD37145.1 hypothetical protein BKCO1_800028 [Diplodia corticola]
MDRPSPAPTPAPEKKENQQQQQQPHRPRQPPSHDYDYPSLDHYAHTHLNATSLPAGLASALAHATRARRARALPDWSAVPSQGKFLHVQCRLLGVRRVLEVGTFAGHGALWCAAAHPALRVTTVEARAEHAAVARESLDAACASASADGADGAAGDAGAGPGLGLGDRVELICGDAVRDVLPRLADEVAAGARERYGMVVVDVEDRRQAWDCLERCVAGGLCAERACVVAHLQVRKSDLSVEAADEKGANARGSREFVEKMGRDPRMSGVLIMSMGEQNYDTVMAVVQGGDGVGASSLA